MSNGPIFSLTQQDIDWIQHQFGDAFLGLSDEANRWIVPLWNYANDALRCMYEDGGAAFPTHRQLRQCVLDMMFRCFTPLEEDDLPPHVVCERCGKKWDSVSPCAMCFATEGSNRV